MISRGSEWHRWEPHIHAPGTILNNQFGAADPWGTTSRPSKADAEDRSDRRHGLLRHGHLRGILKHKASGRLPDVKLVFPNIELRLDVAAKSGFVNIHLLVSPEDPNHLLEVRKSSSACSFMLMTIASIARAMS